MSSSGVPSGGSERDNFYMKEAIRLARRGEGWVSPNPMVGAVVVCADKIISKGYHRRFGGPHAEVEALASGREDLSDATLYVTLEPCCYQGKTPACTELILRRRLKSVVVGCLDPNPQVAGRGVAILREAGMHVRVGVLENACMELNRPFFHWMEKGRPWVTLKWAQSLDGKIATTTGHSQWITSLTSRKASHRLRATHDAVLVGIGTVLRDDPDLTVRHVKGRNPVRVILDTQLKIPFQSKVLESKKWVQGPWLAAAESGDPVKSKELERRGVRILKCSRGVTGGIDINCLLQVLANEGISSVLVEGGAKVLTSFVKARAVQRLVCFIAPVILGKGVDVFEDLGILRVDKASHLVSWKVKRSGEDLMVDALV
jgi:diaminohydroxyphosphoribosylaminopyrimidine deaminase/5-amino-6-(5-phosphoribosylamino)uracil reductase